MIDGLVPLCGALATSLALAALALGLGRLLLGREPADAEALALATPLGLGLLGLGSFALLATDLLRPGPLAGVVLLLVPLALRGLSAAGRDLAALRQAEPEPGSRLVRAAFLLSALVLAFLGLYPPSAWDATTYHLPLARAFAEAGGFRFVAELRVPVFPLLAESLSAALRLPGGELAAQELQVLATLATAGLLAVWTRSRLSARPFANALAAAIFLGSPIVVLYAGTAYVEPLLTLFVTAALAAADRHLRTGEVRFAAIAGGLAGCAAGVKYLGLVFAGLVPASALLAPTPRRIRGAALAALFAALALAPWYLRIVALTGNPLFPYASGLFGPSEWSSGPYLAAGATAGEPGLLPDGPGALPVRLAALPRLPFDLLFARPRYNHQPPFSPALLLLWPALLLVGWRQPWSRPWIALLALYGLSLVPLPADARYLQPVLPLAALLLAAALATAEELGKVLAKALGPLSPRLWRGAALVLWLPLPLYAAFHLARLGALPVSAVAREAYLDRQVPGLRALRSLAPRSTVYLLYLERLHYFAPGRAIGEVNGPARYALIKARLGDPRALSATLRRLGADHLLLPAAVADRLRRDGEFATRFRSVYRDDEAEALEILAVDPQRPEPGGPDRSDGPPGSPDRPPAGG